MPKAIGSPTAPSVLALLRSISVGLLATVTTSGLELRMKQVVWACSLRQLLAQSGAAGDDLGMVILDFRIAAFGRLGLLAVRSGQ